MSISAIILTAILSLAKGEAADLTERPRLEALATDIELAVNDLGDTIPFTGPARKEAAGLVLVAIAYHESGFSARVQDCRLTGDRIYGQAPSEGPSISLWQLKGRFARGKYSREEICSSPRLAAAQAMRVFTGHATRCARSGWLASFQGYASGNCGRESIVTVNGRPMHMGANRCQTWSKLAAKAGLEGVSCDRGRSPITRPAAAP